MSIAAKLNALTGKIVGTGNAIRRMNITVGKPPATPIRQTISAVQQTNQVIAQNKQTIKLLDSKIDTVIQAVRTVQKQVDTVTREIWQVEKEIVERAAGYVFFYFLGWRELGKKWYGYPLVYIIRNKDTNEGIFYRKDEAVDIQWSGKFIPNTKGWCYDYDCTVECQIFGSGSYNSLTEDEKALFDEMVDGVLNGDPPEPLPQPQYGAAVAEKPAEVADPDNIIIKPPVLPPRRGGTI